MFISKNYNAAFRESIVKYSESIENRFENDFIVPGNFTLY